MTNQENGSLKKLRISKISERPVTLIMRSMRKLPNTGTKRIKSNKRIIMKTMIIDLIRLSKKGVCSRPYMLFAVTIIELVPFEAITMPTIKRTKSPNEASVLSTTGVMSSISELSKDKSKYDAISVIEIFRNAAK